MKKITALFAVVLFSAFTYAQDNNQATIDSIEKTFTYQHGKIALKNGVGEITVPNGFKYLDPEQARRVLVELWGNPDSPDISLGLILPETQGVMGDNGYVFNIQYDEIGYVKDDDADEIDYDDLLKQLQEESIAENEERKKQGYDPITFVGWAAKPFYDKEHKILHWAKELKFGNQEVNTLNYNVRILGRKGVLVLNAIATMPDLPVVQKDIHHVLNIVQFNKGFKYADFDSSVDEVAAWTIGGLVAGKVLAKVGLFAVIAKFGKFIVIAIIGAFSAFFKRFRRKKDNDVDNDSYKNTEPDSASSSETAE